MSLLLVKETDLDKVKQRTAQMRKHLVDVLNDTIAAVTGESPYVDGANSDVMRAKGLSLIAAGLGRSFDVLASLVVSETAVVAYTEALAGETDTDKSVELAMSKITESMLRYAVGINPTDKPSGGPHAQGFKADIVKNMAATISAMAIMVEGYNMAEAICERHGLDFQAVVSGDMNAKRAMFDAVQAETGQPIPADILAQLGLAPPVTPQPQPYSGVEASHLLGDEVAEVDDGEPAEGDTIRV